MRKRNRTAIFMHNREGMMQGRPLKIIAYGIGILPLIKNLKQELPKINHPWYHDNAGALGRFVIIDI